MDPRHLITFRMHVGSTTSVTTSGSEIFRSMVHTVVSTLASFIAATVLVLDMNIVYSPRVQNVYVLPFFLA